MCARGAHIEAQPTGYDSTGLARLLKMQNSAAAQNAAEQQQLRMQATSRKRKTPTSTLVQEITRELEQ